MSFLSKLSNPKILLPLLGVFVVLGLGGAYYYYQVYLPAGGQPLIGEETSPPPPGTPPPSVTPEDPTAGWLVYRNDKLSYEFKYPNGWNLKESTSNNYPYIKLTDPIAIEFFRTDPSATELVKGAMYSISVLNYTPTDLEAYVREGAIEGQETILSVESTKLVSGIPGILLVVAFQRSEDYTVTGYSFYFQQGGLLYTLTLSTLEGDPLKSQYKSTFDLINSTLRFVTQ